MSRAGALIGALLLVAPGAGRAEDAAEHSAEDSSWGLAADVGVASAYVFRGYNMFQATSQWDAHAFVAPSVSYAFPQVKGLTVGYWGAYQVVGPNLGSVVAAGLGAENDLTLTYTRPLVGKLTGGLGFTAYVYPAADREIAGTAVPLYLEPAALVSLPTFVELGLKVSYFHGVQDAVSALRYAYLNPTASKTFELSERVSLLLSGSLGYKWFVDGTTATAKFNTLDVLVSAAAPITLKGSLYVKPSVSWAWTNLPGRSIPEKMVVFGGVNLGLTL